MKGRRRKKKEEEEEEEEEEKNRKEEEEKKKKKKKKKKKEEEEEEEKKKKKRRRRNIELSNHFGVYPGESLEMNRRLNPSMGHKPIGSLHMDRHDLHQTASSSTSSIAFRGRFDDPKIRVVQVEGVTFQLFPTMISKGFAPSTGHLRNESHHFGQLLASDTALGSISDGEDLLHGDMVHFHTTWNETNTEFHGPKRAFQLSNLYRAPFRVTVGSIEHAQTK